MADNNTGKSAGAINLLLNIKTNIAEQLNKASAEAKQQAAKQFEAVGRQAGNSYSKGFSASIQKSKATIQSLEKQLNEVSKKTNGIIEDTIKAYADVSMGDSEVLKKNVENSLKHNKEYQNLLKKEVSLTDKLSLNRKKYSIDVRAFEEKKVQSAQKSAQREAAVKQKEAEKQRRKDELADLAAQKAREKRLLKSTKGIRALGSNIKRAFKSVFLMTAVYAAFKTLRTLFASATSDSKKFTDSLNTVKANLMAAFTPIVQAVMPKLKEIVKIAEG